MATLNASFDRKDASFGSVDSRAHGMAKDVSRLRAVALVLTFSILALVQLWIFQQGYLDGIFTARDYVLGPYEGQHIIAVRVYIVSFYISFAMFATGTRAARLSLGVDLVLRYMALCALLDVGSVALLGYIGAPYPLSAIEIIAGLLGFALFAFTLLERGAMPAAVPMKTGHGRELSSLIRLGVVAVISTMISSWAIFSDHHVFDGLRDLTLLGGIGPGVVVFLPSFFGQLYLIELVERRLLARTKYAPPLSVIVPAHDEEYIIAETILHIDEAAAEYAAPVEVIILDNASKDRTAEIAEETLAKCKSLTGRVVAVPKPGKAHALNVGVAMAQHDLVVRIDADTQVRPGTFALAAENFADPETGAVGGIPIPPGGAMFDGARLVEVMVKHGFYSPALSSVSGLVGIPGMFCAYRAEALREAGEFASGMNGEDTDMSLRIAELGYRTLVDHRVSYVSEVPTSFAHMREQRLRWFRSVYHVTARCECLLTTAHFSIRGKLILPYMLLNTGRRAMMVPMMIFGLFQLLLSSDEATMIAWQAIVAVLVGAPALVALAAILINKRPRALVSLPSYVLFRGLRAWFTLESALTIPINMTSRRQASEARATGSTV